MTAAEQCIEALTHGTPTLDETKQACEGQLAELAVEEKALLGARNLHSLVYRGLVEEARQAEAAKTTEYSALVEVEDKLRDVQKKVQQVNTKLGEVSKYSREHLVSVLRTNTEFSETDAMLQYASLVVPGTIHVNELVKKTVVSFRTTEHTIEDTSTGNSWGMFCARNVEVTIVHDGFTRHATMQAYQLYELGNIIACTAAEYACGTTAIGKIHYTHPHVQSNGMCCLGNAAEMLLAAFKRKNILELILTACKFLCSYDAVNPYRHLTKFINPAQPDGHKHISPWQRDRAWCVDCNDVSKEGTCTHMKAVKVKQFGMHTCSEAELLRMCPACGDNVDTHAGTGWCTSCMNNLLKFSFASLKSRSRLRGFIGRVNNGYS